MDIKREGVARKKQQKRILYGALGLVAIVFVTVGLSRLEPAAPSVDANIVYRGTVERGAMVRNVRGSGTIIPDENSIRWISAETSGKVERIRMKAGEVVKPDTIILEMSNPQARQDLLQAESSLRQARANLTGLEVQLRSGLMQQEVSAAQVESDALTAQLEYERDVELAKSGLVSDLDLKISEARAKTLTKRNDIEKRRLAIAPENIDAQLESSRAQVQQARSLYNLRDRQVRGLKVRAGIAGILQEVPVEVGQQAAPGTNLARVVAEGARLKAEINVAATQARDVVVGLKAKIDTRNGIVDGIVSRVDPAVVSGLVTVDVDLIGDLPPGARVALNVDGTIELERLEDILFVGRPVFGQEHSTVGLFRMEEDGVHASRVQVQLGRSSVTLMEVISGLVEGDEVILSDTSQWDSFDRIRLN